MLTQQESKNGGRGGSPERVLSPTVDSVYSYTMQSQYMYTNIISVIYKQKKELLITSTCICNNSQ